MILPYRLEIHMFHVVCLLLLKYPVSLHFYINKKIRLIINIICKIYITLQLSLQ